MEFGSEPQTTVGKSDGETQRCLHVNEKSRSGHDLSWEAIVMALMQRCL